MEFLCVDKIFPEYCIWEQFVKDYYFEALELDCLRNSHPIQVSVDHPSTISSIFDSISYDKGSSVIRMLNNYLGDDTFKKGMNLYLTRHQYDNAETQDLWAALGEASGKPVSKIMSTWTKQMGFPLITVNKVTQVGDEKVLSLSYDKYWSCPKLKAKGSDFKWIIPLTVRKQSDPTGVATFSLVDEEPQKEFEVRVPASEKEWIKVLRAMNVYKHLIKLLRSNHSIFCTGI
jgi:puromycin-sensitive aminopeptidase